MTSRHARSTHAFGPATGAGERASPVANKCAQSEIWPPFCSIRGTALTRGALYQTSLELLRAAPRLLLCFPPSFAATRMKFPAKDLTCAHIPSGE